MKKKEREKNEKKKREKKKNLFFSLKFIFLKVDSYNINFFEHHQLKFHYFGAILLFLKNHILFLVHPSLQ